MQQVFGLHSVPCCSNKDHDMYCSSVRRVLQDRCFSNPDKPWYRPQATRTDPLKPALITIFVKEEVSAKTILTAEQEDKEFTENSWDKLIDERIDELLKDVDDNGVCKWVAVAVDFHI